MHPYGIRTPDLRGRRSGRGKYHPGRRRGPARRRLRRKAKARARRLAAPS